MARQKCRVIFGKEKQMATVGLSRVYVAKYNANGGNPTYSDGTLQPAARR